MKSAVKPNLRINVPVLDRVNDKDNEATDEEKALYVMAKTAGWKIFEDLAKETNNQLNEVNRGAIAQGLPLEEIGRNAIVVDLAQGVIKRLLDKVSDAIEACERENN